MASWGNANFEQIKAFNKAIDKLGTSGQTTLCVSCSKALAARLLALVIPKTPVGKYAKSTGKKGGTLRRGWGAKSGSAANGYAQSLAVHKTGNVYMVEIINPIEYASYVEFGHRTTSGGWVEGQYMLTISEEKLKRIAPSVLEKLVLEKLREVCDV